MIVHLAALLAFATVAGATPAPAARGPPHLERHVEQWLSTASRGFCATTGIGTFDSSCGGLLPPSPTLTLTRTLTLTPT